MKERTSAMPETRTEPADALLTAREVATLLHVSPATLCRWRQAGTGPAVVWLGSNMPRYRRADVANFVERQTDPRT